MGGNVEHQVLYVIVTKYFPQKYKVHVQETQLALFDIRDSIFLHIIDSDGIIFLSLYRYGPILNRKCLNRSLIKLLCTCTHTTQFDIRIDKIVDTLFLSLKLIQNYSTKTTSYFDYFYIVTFKKTLDSNLKSLSLLKNLNEDLL